MRATPDHARPFSALINRRLLHRIAPFTLVVSCITLSICPTTCRGNTDRSGVPNIIFILADDLGYGDPHCYNDQSKIPTPHIDQLAQSGMRLTDAHTPSSVCTPTRYGLLTGRFCWRSPLKQGVLWVWDPPLIEPDRLTMAKMFQQLGYDTACVGKWHLGWDWPLKNGGYITDEFAGHMLSAQQRDEYTERIDFARAHAVVRPLAVSTRTLGTTSPIFLLIVSSRTIEQ